jgi:hypothetical protein
MYSSGLANMNHQTWLHSFEMMSQDTVVTIIIVMSLPKVLVDHVNMLEAQLSSWTDTERFLVTRNAILDTSLKVTNYQGQGRPQKYLDDCQRNPSC